MNESIKAESVIPDKLVLTAQAYLGLHFAQMH